MCLNLAGGGVSYFTAKSDCELKVTNSLFLKNLADFAGAIDFSNPAGTAFLSNNKIAYNIARKISNITGAGSAIKLSGSASTMVYSYKNYFIENWGLARGMEEKLNKLNYQIWS